MMTNMTMTSSITNNCADKLPDHIHIFSIEDHEYWKPKILESIDSMKEINNIEPNKQGYYYDWGKTLQRTYGSLVENILYPYFIDLGEMYGLKWMKYHDPTYSRYWFQQYIQGSKFGWHQHSGHWAFVYFVELPEPNEATEFLNYGTFNVKEGDLLCFPTFLVHRAPEITSNLRKTIVAVNQSFVVNRELIGNDPERFRNR